MKKYILLFLIIPFLSNSQEYVDLINIGYSNTFNASFEGTNEKTDVISFFTNLTFPIIVNKRSALITGVDFSTHQLQLFPKAETTRLYNMLLKIGLATTYSDTWSSTFVFLPKVSSDYKNISGDDLYFGGIAVLKYQKTDRLKYRFGLYASTEAFGVFATPIVGAYYTSEDNRFEMDLSLPISADINYNLGKTTVGFDYYGIGRSFHLDTHPEVYVEQNPLEFSSYIQFNALQKSLLLRAKIGYTSNENEVYAMGDKVDLRISAFNFGDNRTQLNPDINGSIFIKFEAIYRFHIAKENNEIKN